MVREGDKGSAFGPPTHAPGPGTATGRAEAAAAARRSRPVTICGGSPAGRNEGKPSRLGPSWIGAETGRSAPAPASARASNQRWTIHPGQAASHSRMATEDPDLTLPMRLPPVPKGHWARRHVDSGARLPVGPHGRATWPERSRPEKARSGAVGGRRPPAAARHRDRDAQQCVPTPSARPRRAVQDGLRPAAGQAGVDAGQARQETSPRKVTWPRLPRVGFGVPAWGWMDGDSSARGVRQPAVGVE